MKTISSLAVGCGLGLAAFSSISADPIAAQPIGLIDKNFASNNEQSDFFYAYGPSKGGFVSKLLFTAKVKDLANGKDEMRALFEQDLQTPNGFEIPPFYAINKTTSPLKKIATFTVPQGTKFDSFLEVGDSGTGKKPHFKRMFFHVPTKGLYSTEGGKSPTLARAEVPKDSSTFIKGTAIRLQDYVFDNNDPELQSRLVFGGKDPAKGREPMIYTGSGAPKVLKDIYTDKKVGSEPDQFAALGPQNSSQHLFFVAKSPNDGDTYQLWVMTQQFVGTKYVYDAIPFTTDLTALAGKPENLIANDADLFFTAPVTAGGTPVLWHLAAASNLDASQLEHYDNAVDPKNLTFTTKDPHYSELAFSALDGNSVRRYARWSSFGNAVTILGAAAKLNDPSLITDSGQYFYFASHYDGGATTFLEKHFPGDNSITDITLNNGTTYPTNIKEICAETSDGTGGWLYFVADGKVDGVDRNAVLFRIDANDSGGIFQSDAEPVRTPLGNPVVGAHNLRAVVSAGNGMFRLYFSAPVNSQQNAEFIPVNSTITDFGTKPWVTE